MGRFCHGQINTRREPEPGCLRRSRNGRGVRRYGAGANCNIDYGSRDDRWLWSDRSVDARDHHCLCCGKRGHTCRIAHSKMQIEKSAGGSVKASESHFAYFSLATFALSSSSITTRKASKGCAPTSKRLFRKKVGVPRAPREAATAVSPSTLRR